MIVRSKQRRRFRRGTLLGWLGESVRPEVEHLEAEPIHSGRNKPFTSHETIKQFYAETTREEPLNGKRHLEIHLASGGDVVGKAGRPKGSTKVARAAADASVGRGLGRHLRAEQERVVGVNRHPCLRIGNRWAIRRAGYQLVHRSGGAHACRQLQCVLIVNRSSRTLRCHLPFLCSNQTPLVRTSGGGAEV